MARAQVDAIIGEFQRRRREFRPQWTRNFLTLALPGFALFALGHPMAVHVPALAVAGFVLFGAGMLRGFLIAWRHLRCPVCDRFQTPRKCFPHRACLGCGAALSFGAEDS